MIVKMKNKKAIDTQTIEIYYTSDFCVKLVEHCHKQIIK